MEKSQISITTFWSESCPYWPSKFYTDKYTLKARPFCTNLLKYFHFIKLPNFYGKKHNKIASNSADQTSIK